MACFWVIIFPHLIAADLKSLVTNVDSLDWLLVSIDICYLHNETIVLYQNVQVAYSPFTTSIIWVGISV